MNGIQVFFYIAAAVAVLSTALAIAQINAVRALLYLILSLLAVAVIFYILGAPFAAALEIITYAGAIMVLFVFVMMILNLGPVSLKQEKKWLNAKMWVGPALLAAVILGEWVFAIFWGAPVGNSPSLSFVEPDRVGTALLGPYAWGVEVASMLLLAGLVGAYHLGFRTVEQRAPSRISPEPRRLRLVSNAPGEKKAGAS